MPLKENQYPDLLFCGKKMPTLVVVFVLPLFSTLGQSLEPVIPKSYPLERYEVVWKKSPFTLSSNISKPTAGFAVNLVLAGVIKIGDTPYVCILDKSTLEQEFITNTPNAKGIQLLKVQSSNKLEEVTVTLGKGDEISTLRYDMGLPKTPFTATNQPEAPEPEISSEPISRTIRRRHPVLSDSSTANE